MRGSHTLYRIGSLFVLIRLRLRKIHAYDTFELSKLGFNFPIKLNFNAHLYPKVAVHEHETCASFQASTYLK